MNVLENQKSIFEPMAMINIFIPAKLLFFEQKTWFEKRLAKHFNIFYE